VGSLKSNGGKLGVSAVLLLVAFGVYWVTMRGGHQRDNRIPFVCVETGDIKWVTRGKTMVLPLENPDTGKYTLVPCRKNEDGGYTVVKRYASVLKQLDKDGINKFVDSETLLVREH